MTRRRILIFLPASWVIVDENNKILETVAEGDLNQISQTKEELIVFVPSQEVLLTSAKLPKLSKHRLQQALPFAIEEKLISDVNDLHFAVGDYQPDGVWPVAVVSKQKMQEWLAILNSLNLIPSALIPSVFVLLYKENHWHINSYQDLTLVRTGAFSGFACETDNKNTLLQFALTNAGATKVITIETEFSPVELLQQSINTINKHPNINLLQSTFQTKLPATQIKKVWLWSTYLALTCLALLVISNLISIFILQRYANQLESQINKIYYRHFPQAKSVVAPRERMTEKLNKISNIAAKNNLLSIMTIIAKNHDHVAIKHFDFREEHLSLEIIADSFDNLDAFKKKLTQQGLQVKQQTATILETKVKATLLITAG